MCHRPGGRQAGAAVLAAWPDVVTIVARIGTNVPPAPAAKGGIKGEMFVGDEIMLDAAYPDARSGLLRLTHGGWLSDASGDVYAEGLAGLVRVGPFGDVPGASKLVRVRLLDPVERAGSLTLILRWEATGVMGPLFPVLDANIVLIPAGENASQLALAGAYRPPFAAAGRGLDRVLLHRAASATVRSLLRRMAETITAATPIATGPEPAAPGTKPAVPAAEMAVPSAPQPEAGRESPA
jgi:hypothetical protein